MAKQILLVHRFVGDTVNDDAIIAIVDRPTMVVQYAEALLDKTPACNESLEIGLMRTVNAVPVDWNPLMKWDGEQWHICNPDGSWIAAQGEEFIVNCHSPGIAEIASKFNGTGPVIEPATDFGGES